MKSDLRRRRSLAEPMGAGIDGNHVGTGTFAGGAAGAYNGFLGGPGKVLDAIGALSTF